MLNRLIKVLVAIILLIVVFILVVTTVLPFMDGFVSGLLH